MRSSSDLGDIQSGRATWQAFQDQMQNAVVQAAQGKKENSGWLHCSDGWVGG
jgi:hypothetical protein